MVLQEDFAILKRQKCFGDLVDQKILFRDAQTFGLRTMQNLRSYLTVV